MVLLFYVTKFSENKEAEIVSGPQVVYQLRKRLKAAYDVLGVPVFAIDTVG